MKANPILGFDCSSKAIHMVKLDEGGSIVEMRSWKDTTRDIDARVNKILDDFEGWMDAISAHEYPLVAAIEEPIYIQNFKATVGIAYVVGGTKRVLHNLGIPFFPIGNKSWKKYVVGTGNASKEQIMQFAQVKWSENKFLEQDYADAACIAEWGAQRFGRGDND
jgi:Holliday junction resolvasome RuvABC endonuclease subunit